MLPRVQKLPFKKKKKIHTGIVGDYGCISFNGNKVITSGGGGIILVNKRKIEKIRYLINQSKDDTLYYKHHNLGFHEHDKFSCSIGFLN